MITIVKQYSVFMPNKPGALSEFMKLFADRQVNIIGIASEIRDDSGVVRIAVENDSKISHILTQAGFSTIEAQMLSIDLSDEPGRIYQLSKLLGSAGINITTVYGTGGSGKSAKLLMAVSDIKKAYELLEKSLESLK